MSTGARKYQAALCARAEIDLFFAEAGYGTMADASRLAEQIAEALDREGRLS